MELEACPVTPFYCLIISSELKSWYTVLVWLLTLSRKPHRQDIFAWSSRTSLILCSLFYASGGWTVLTTIICSLSLTSRQILLTGSTRRWSEGREDWSKIKVLISLDPSLWKLPQAVYDLRPKSRAPVRWPLCTDFLPVLITTPSSCPLVLCRVMVPHGCKLETTRSCGFSIPWASFANSPFVKNLLKLSSLTMSSVSCWSPNWYTSFPTSPRKGDHLCISSRHHSECPHMPQIAFESSALCFEIAGGCGTSLYLFSFS